jgi:hypothetical protein
LFAAEAKLCGNRGERVTYDIIGDVHGELPALTALGRELGYDVDGGWVHP